MLVPRGALERRAVVVKLVLRLPTHAVTTLTFARLLPPRQAELRFGQSVEVRRENDAPRVARPMFGVQGRIIVRQVRITRVTEDAFDKVQIADQPARDEEAHFHALLRRDPGHFGTNHRPEEEGDETLGRLGERRGERQTQQFRRRLQCGF